MTEDGTRAERARSLLGACGVAAGEIAAEEAVRRADAIAAAAEADASVFDETWPPSSSRATSSGHGDHCRRPLSHHVAAMTGGRATSTMAAVVGIRDGRVTHEHIYWDQATILVQVGAFDPAACR